MRVGVYLGQVLGSSGINLETVAHYARNLPDVELVRVLGIRPQLDPHALRDEIRAAPRADREDAAGGPGASPDGAARPGAGWPLNSPPQASVRPPWARR